LAEVAEASHKLLIAQIGHLWRRCGLHSSALSPGSVQPTAGRFSIADDAPVAVLVWSIHGKGTELHNNSIRATSFIVGIRRLRTMPSDKAMLTTVSQC
jgi:hypothetical protein